MLPLARKGSPHTMHGFVFWPDNGIDLPAEEPCAAQGMETTVVASDLLSMPGLDPASDGSNSLLPLAFVGVSNLPTVLGTLAAGCPSPSSSDYSSSAAAPEAASDAAGGASVIFCAAAAVANALMLAGLRVCNCAP